MRSSVRYAAACAAALLVFTACGGDNTDAPTAPSLDQGPLIYTITPATTTWTRLIDGPVPTDPKTVLIGGLIAVGGYPFFGAMQWDGVPYGGAPADFDPADYQGWVTMTTAPDLSRSPLAWRFTFKLTPKAETLPIGRYTLTIPVNVGGAQNNPQSIVVVFNHCNNCLFVGDERISETTTGSPTWNRSSSLNESGGYFYEDWRVFVPPFTTVQVDMFGDNASDHNCGPYTTGDPYLYAFGPTPATTFVDSDDDSGCGYDSIIYITNGTGAQQEYLVRATNYSSGNYGTYKIRVSLSGCGGYGCFTLRAKDPGDKVTADPPPQP